MVSTFTVMNGLLEEFRSRGEIHVNGYETVTYHHQTGNVVYICCGSLPERPVRAISILRAIRMVRRNPGMYMLAPQVTHRAGAGHISDAVWSILHLKPLEQLLA